MGQAQTLAVQGHFSRSRKEGAGKGCKNCNYTGQYFLKGKCRSCGGFGRLGQSMCYRCSGNGYTDRDGHYWKCNHC